MAVTSDYGSTSDEDLSEFVVKEYSHKPSESGNSKVRERQLASAKHIVKEWHVGDEYLEHAYKDQAQVSTVVYHTLLRN